MRRHALHDAPADSSLPPRGSCNSSTIILLPLPASSQEWLSDTETLKLELQVRQSIRRALIVWRCAQVAGMTTALPWRCYQSRRQVLETVVPPVADVLGVTQFHGAHPCECQIVLNTGREHERRWTFHWVHDEALSAAVAALERMEDFMIRAERAHCILVSDVGIGGMLQCYPALLQEVENQTGSNDALRTNMLVK